MQAAKERNVNVIGISFHVGSAATNPKAFEEGISAAKQAWELAEGIGFSMSVLDIGGGFSSSSFAQIPHAVNWALDKHFPERAGLQIISEPGR